MHAPKHQRNPGRAERSRITQLFAHADIHRPAGVWVFVFFFYNEKKQNTKLN